jgi:hypothetical protein
MRVYKTGKGNRQNGNRYGNTYNEKGDNKTASQDTNMYLKTV